MRQLLGKAGPFLGLLLVVLLFGSLRPAQFFSVYNLQIVLMQAVPVALGALGMTFVVIAGGIDLSIGAVVALCAVAAAACGQGGLPIGLAVVCGIALGGLCGLGNGLLVTRLRVVPFIVTLGTMGVARGLAKWLAGNQKIDADAGFLQWWVRNVPSPAWLGVGAAVWLTAVIALLLAVLLRRTVFGLHVFAVGSNEANARLCGVPVERTKFGVYALCGLLAGLIGVLLWGTMNVGDPTAGSGLELKVVAAVVIGGASLAGGEGSLVGALIGAVLMGVLRNGCTLTGVPDHVQDILIGAIIVVAVALDRWRQR
ncbi:MAG: ABC transporter permease [Planctomycetes bacterium]|nr:ABC transporter permease [Planctomycetota bacterium]